MGIHRRIEWIDASKAIGILLVIIGHTFEYNSLARNVIFSFHMPLFFILSGYTFHFRKLSAREFGQKTIKDAEHLLIPVAVITVLDCLWKFDAASFDKTAIKNIVIDKLLALFWASAYSVNKPFLGITWFLISMFWGRFIIRVLLTLFKSEKVPFICIALGLYGVLLGQDHELPQNLDVTIVAVMFMAVGNIARNYNDWIKKYKYAIFICSAIFWQICVLNGLYIEMGTRSYPLGMLCILEAVCGSFVCCNISDALMSNAFLKRGMLFLGQHTLLLLSIHCLDSHWNSLWNRGGVCFSSFLRVITDIIVWLIIMIGRTKISSARK